jgi:hypothetical protein
VNMLGTRSSPQASTCKLEMGTMYSTMFRIQICNLVCDPDLESFKIWSSKEDLQTQREYIERGPRSFAVVVFGSTHREKYWREVRGKECAVIAGGGGGKAGAKKGVGRFQRVFPLRNFGSLKHFCVDLACEEF